MSAKSELAIRVSEAIRPLIEAMGFELVRVKLMGSRRKTLQIMAERPDGSMTVEDCAELSNALSALLDVEDLIAGEYALEVSSPGIDRPLVRPLDFERYNGHLAKIKMDLPLDGRKRFVGVISGLEGDAVIIDLKDASPEHRRVSLPLEQIDEAKLVLTDRLIEASLAEAGTG